MRGFASKPTTMCRAFSTWAPRIGGPKNWIVQEQSQEDWFFVEHPWTSYRWHKKRNNQWTLYPIFCAWNLWLCCLTSRVYHAMKKNLEVDGSTTQNILKPPASPCFTHLLRLYQGVSLLWSHPWTQPQIWQRWSTLAIFGIGAVQGDFSWFDGVQWCSFFQKINVINMEPIKMGSEEYVRGRHDLVSCTMIPWFFDFWGFMRSWLRILPMLPAGTSQRNTCILALCLCWTWLGCCLRAMPLSNGWVSIVVKISKQYQNISKPYVCQILSGSKAQLRSLWYSSFNSPLA